MKTLLNNYPGEIPRPLPEISEISGSEVIAFISAWGKPEGATLATDTLKSYFETNSADPEATSPFSKLAYLNSRANQIRTASYLVNQALFQKLNSTSYQTGIEMMLLAREENEISYVQIGQPALLLFRDGALQPLSATTDLSNQFSQIDALPSGLVGVEKKMELEVHSFHLLKTDKLAVVSRSYLPRSFFAANFGNIDDGSFLQAVLNLSFDDNPQMPCWIGLVDPFSKAA